MANKATSVPNIFPSFRYEDAPGAIEWLNKAFGFEKQFVVPGENTTVAHAQLRLGAGMIMMGSAGKPDPMNPWATERRGTYVVVADIDVHLCACEGGRREDRATAGRHRIRVARVLGARLPRPPVELRHLRPLRRILMRAQEAHELRRANGHPRQLCRTRRHFLPLAKAFVPDGAH